VLWPHKGQDGDGLRMEAKLMWVSPQVYNKVCESGFNDLTEHLQQ
jgi:hypothetical protein